MEGRRCHKPDGEKMKTSKEVSVRQGKMSSTALLLEKKSKMANLSTPQLKGDSDSKQQREEDKQRAAWPLHARAHGEDRDLKTAEEEGDWSG